MRRAGFGIGPGARLSAQSSFSFAGAFGGGCYVNARCLFDVPVRLGERVFVGPGTSFVSNHDIGGREQRAGSAPRSRLIDVGHGAWIGAHCVILEGTSIGAGSIVAAGAVVVDDCAPDTLYGGVPAREIRRLVSDA